MAALPLRHLARHLRHLAATVASSSLSPLATSSRLLSAAAAATTTTTSAAVGFVGLGQMGSRMVQNLLKAGYQVHVCDAIRRCDRYCTLHNFRISLPFCCAGASCGTDRK